MSNIVKTVCHPSKALIYLAEKGCFDRMDDRTYLKLMYRWRMGERLDLKDPHTFQEKLQWLKLYDRNPDYIRLVDKYLVRECIGKTIGEEYLVPILGLYERFDEIDFDRLPQRFVLKCTHDSGSAVICRNKEQFDRNAAKDKLNRSLRKNFFYHGREWPYKYVKPKIICETYLEHADGRDLKDFKFMCFHGVPKMIYVCGERRTFEKPLIDFYDTEWNLLPVRFSNHAPSGIPLEKPFYYHKMLAFASILSHGFPFLRVDFYDVNGKLYVGELTFSPSSGFEKLIPESYNKLLGSWIPLPELESCNE